MQADLKKAKKFLSDKVSSQISNEGIHWLDQVIYDLETKPVNRSFFIAFSMAPRFTGKEKLLISENDIKEADYIRKGWYINDLTIDRAVRLLLILNAYNGNIAEHKNILNKLLYSGDLRELEAVFSSLPLLPHPQEHYDLALEGKRINMSAIFDRIALNNPFPADYLKEDSWNQMILKAVFIERPLYKIYGLNERINMRLASMLIDYVHERWAAGRTTTPELWRLISPFTDNVILRDIEKLFDQEPIHQLAAALICSTSKLPRAKKMLASKPHLEQMIQEENISWDTIGEKWVNKN